MNKYIIVTRDWNSDSITADNKEEAMDMFVAKMNMDMNTYFEVVPEDEYNSYISNKNYEASKKCTIEFMTDELVSVFSLDEDDAEDVAAIAYEFYCKGDGRTEYECIEDAYQEFISNK